MAIIEMGLIVEKPNISISGLDWTAKDDKTIIPSLTFIKGVGESAVPEIVKHQPYNSLEEFFNSNMEWRLVNKRVMEALIKTGAFDELYTHRKRLLYAYTSWNTGKKNWNKHIKKAEEEFTEEDFTFDERMNIEKELYGFYFSANPLDKYKPILEKHSISEISKLTSGKKWKSGTLYGILTKVFPYRISTGTMCFLDVQSKDDTKANITMWPEFYDKYKSILQEGNVVAIKVKTGKTKDGSSCFYIDDTDERKKVVLMQDLLEMENNND
jgi:DNA polymerase-3 subunit alpha